MVDNISNIVFILIAILSFLIIVFLISEIEATIRVKKDGRDFNLDIKINWLFFKIYHREISKTNNFRKDTKNHSNGQDILKSILPLIKNNIHGLSKLFIVLTNSIKLEKSNGNLLFGFYSPVTTAITFAAINNVFTIANIHDKSNLNVNADFTKEVLYFDGATIFKIRPLKPTFAILRFIANKSGFELIKQIRNIYKY